MASVREDLRKLADPEYAMNSQRFFKTGKGEYGEGDKFLGIRVPLQREIAKKHKTASLKEILSLIKSKYHEERFTGFVILVDQYQNSKDSKEAEKLYKTYLSSFEYINNWDLVDSTCHKIIGIHLLNRDRKILYKWAKSKNLWTRRISIISTFAFIAHMQLDDSFALAQQLLHDDHDLMHKAVGWVLRECSKKDRSRLESFLEEHYQSMPRTMLRYAIEKLPERRRQQYLKDEI